APDGHLDHVPMMRRRLPALMVHLIEFLFVLMIQQQQRSTMFPYTTLFRSRNLGEAPTTEIEIPPVPNRSTKAEDGTSARHELLRSEEHTSELQSRENLVCRHLLEKKKSTVYEGTEMMAYYVHGFTKMTDTT